jgi:hypothetical protein
MSVLRTKGEEMKKKHRHEVEVIETGTDKIGRYKIYGDCKSCGKKGTGGKVYTDFLSHIFSIPVKVENEIKHKTANGIGRVGTRSPR